MVLETARFNTGGPNGRQGLGDGLVLPGALIPTSRIVGEDDHLTILVDLHGGIGVPVIRMGHLPPPIGPETLYFFPGGSSHGDELLQGEAPSQFSDALQPPVLVPHFMFCFSIILGDAIMDPEGQVGPSGCCSKVTGNQAPRNHIREKNV